MAALSPDRRQDEADGPALTWSRFNRLYHSERFGHFLYNALSNTLVELDEKHYRRLEGLRDGRRDAARGGRIDDELPALLRSRHVLVETGEEERLLLALHQRRTARCFAGSSLTLIASRRDVEGPVDLSVDRPSEGEDPHPCGSSGRQYDKDPTRLTAGRVFVH